MQQTSGDTPEAAAVAGVQAAGAGESRGGSRAGRVAWLLARLGITGGAFAYLLSQVEFGQLSAAFGRVPARAVLVSLSLYVAAVWLGAYRWRILFASCGASRVPGYLQLLRLTFIGLFYNTYLPGAVGGDLVRGVATGGYFDEGGSTSALAVSFLDRVLGFAGLLVMAALAFSLHPVHGVEGLLPWAGAGLLAVSSVVLVLTTGRHLGRFLPSALARIADRLPQVQSVLGIVVVLCIALFGHAMYIAIGHVLVLAVSPGVGLADSAVIIPGTVVASAFPLTVAGAGPTEAAFVALYGLVGVARPDALAASLLILLCRLLVAGSGGVVSVFEGRAAQTED
ncbi:MAG: flippase-like domain-containing protein [Myxococcales bacterium]|nr:flippase-like domain-containing protein [Myxococcales bacterium]